MKAVGILLMLVALCGCVSPYSALIRQTKQDFRTGKISPAEYQQRITQLYALDTQYKDAHDYNSAFAPRGGGRVVYQQQQTMYAPQPYPQRVDVYHHSSTNPGLSIVPFPY